MATSEDIQLIFDAVRELYKSTQWDKLKESIRASERYWLKHLPDIRAFVTRKEELLKCAQLLTSPETEQFWYEMNQDNYVPRVEHLEYFFDATREAVEALLETHDFRAQPILYLEESGNLDSGPALIVIDRVAVFGKPQRWLYRNTMSYLRSISMFTDQSTNVLYKVVTHIWNQVSVPRTTHACFAGVQAKQFPMGVYVYEMSVVPEEKRYELAQECLAKAVKCRAKIARRCANPGCSVWNIACLRKCARCASVYYCGRDCQSAHWSAHKQACHRA